MKVEFKFRKIASELFGEIYRPYADIIAYGRNGKARGITLVVDTGADYTIFPRREAALLGIDLDRDCTIHTTFGVGGARNVYLYKDLHVSLGNKKFKIPVGFLDTNEVPPLLGRQQFLELIKTCFVNHIVSFGFPQ